MMQNEHFFINKDIRQKEVSPGNLYTSLNKWGLMADQFFRTSEVLYIQLIRSNQKVIQSPLEFQKTGNFVNRDYAPSLDYILQIGHCLENMIKRVLTFNNPELIDSREIAKGLKSHKLGTFTPDLRNIQFSAEDKQLLEFVTTIIIWYGKYPIPAKAEEAIRSPAHNIVKLRETFFNLYDKLSIEMESTGNLALHLHRFNRQTKSEITKC